MANAIAEQIRQGEVADGARLPSEADLADEFGVSRATVRSALALLQVDGLVETWNGSGSFVRFDGEDLVDQGWGSAFAHRGMRATTRLLSFGRIALPEVAADLGLTAPFFLLTERVRSVDGVPVSLERSRVPWRPELSAAVERGPLTGSLQEVLLAAGIRAARFTENVSVRILGQDEAQLLDAVAGAGYLRVDRRSYDADDRVTEQVISLLNPTHFTISREGRL
ncbi:MAG: GntR family transcriptional regulator [Propioniciclava sp.]